MAIWEYKVISSGKGGFATPALLENFINQLGKDEWEIISFQTAPDNPLAFQGLARRGMQREWNLEAAAAAKAKADEQKRLADERAAREAEIQREERGEEPPDPSSAPAEDTPMRDQKMRTVRDTENDDDPDALAAEAAGETVGDWDEWPEEDELPTLFDAIKPHLRRNQRGPGQAVAIDYLAKRWNQLDEDIVGALEECGFTLPENDEDTPDYFEFEGDLYWLNRNNRGQLFLNVREKPRPKFKPASMRKVDADDPVAAEVAAEHQAERDREAERKAKQAAQDEERRAKREAEREARAAKQAARAEAGANANSNGNTANAEKSDNAEAPPPPPVPDTLPAGEELMVLLRSRMRRNRRGPGVSGSTAFLAKAFKQEEAAIVEALVGAGLVVPEDSSTKVEQTEIGDGLYWLNKDNRGGLWINGRERPTEKSAKETSSDDDKVPAGESADASGSAEAVPDAETVVGEAVAPGSTEGTEAKPAETPATAETSASADGADGAETDNDSASADESASAEADDGAGKPAPKKKTARKGASRSRGRGKKGAGAKDDGGGAAEGDGAADAAESTEGGESADEAKSDGA